MGNDDIQSILAGIPLPLILVGIDERIRRLNPAAAELFGADMLGRHFYTVLRQPGIIDCVGDAFRSSMARETRFSQKDHSQETIYRVICSPVGQGSEAGVLISLEDVTSVETAGQMRRDFVANVSHELRTPLTALLGFIETLRGPARDDADARDRFLATMQHEAERMNRLVNDLLSLSRVETQERIRPTDLLDLPEIVRSVCLGLRPLTDGAGIEVDVAAADNLPLVQGDADQLRQVFNNLVENAAKYAGDGKRIDIRFETVDRDPILGRPALATLVRDHGAGIDAIHLHRLTERFYRVDNHRSSDLGGTGLGLAIVKHILNRHRGRLKIDSTLGRGSVFSVILPVPAKSPNA